MFHAIPGCAPWHGPGGSYTAILLLTLLLTLPGGATAQTTVEPETVSVSGLAATETETEAAEEDGTVLEVATGCAAGALAGSVLPGIGNLVGCAVGGLGAWVFDWF